MKIASFIVVTLIVTLVFAVVLAMIAVEGILVGESDIEYSFEE